MAKIATVLFLTYSVGFGISKFLRSRKVVGREVEKRAQGLLDTVDAEPDDINLIKDPWLNRGFAAGGGSMDDLNDLTEEVVTNESEGRGQGTKAVTVRKVRRGLKVPFVKWWVSWGKAQFPSVWRGATAADRVCIMNALCREMRTKSVRDSDIARVKDEITLGIMLPSVDEVRVAEMEATWVAQKRQEATRGLTNRKGGTGLKLGVAR